MIERMAYQVATGFSTSPVLTLEYLPSGTGLLAEHLLEHLHSLSLHSRHQVCVEILGDTWAGVSDPGGNDVYRNTSLNEHRSVGVTEPVKGYTQAEFFGGSGELVADQARNNGIIFSHAILRINSKHRRLPMKVKRHRMVNVYDEANCRKPEEVTLWV